ncbi:hypothetical protein BCT59_11960 [Vibrio breoganii]|nr:hypothetical protein BCT59_11960 [Vibrio breoganii]
MQYKEFMRPTRALSLKNPEPRTQNPEPRTQNPEPRTQNPEPQPQKRPPLGSLSNLNYQN